MATTNKALSCLEHGAGLDVCKLPELARALDCSLTYLVGLNDDPTSWEPDFEHWPGRRPTRERPAPVRHRRRDGCHPGPVPRPSSVRSGENARRRRGYIRRISR